jgi:hypothetical protein
VVDGDASTDGFRDATGDCSDTDTVGWTAGDETKAGDSVSRDNDVDGGSKVGPCDDAPPIISDDAAAVRLLTEG